MDVVKRHVELRRAGTGSWKGLCPFHAEKTPSFHVHEQRQFFHCFGCGETGDVFKFLEKIEQRSFMEILRDLAQQAAVELPEKEQSPAERRAAAEAQSERERMLRTMELATAFFEEQLAGPAGAGARAYLASRGLGAETIGRFRLGYAPAGWDVLQKHLAGKQVPPTVSERLGLVGVNDRGRYDFFRDRVMLPVLDRQKRPLGYSSRLLDPEAKDRKYVNSPDSPLFHKKENLYGLHAALDAIRRKGTAVLVEGNFDVLALHEAGVDEAVAPMGTALTAEQVGLLARMAQRVVVVFDGDEAGQRAARKSLPLFLEADVDGRVARLPAGVDPDDHVRKAGADAFRKLIEGARPVVEQFIDDLAHDVDGSIPDRVRALETAGPVLARVRNPTARELYAGRLATTLGVKPAEVQRAVRAAGAGGGPRPGASAASATGGAGAPPTATATAARTPPRDELEAATLLLTHPELASREEAKRILDLLVDPGVSHIYRIALEALRRGDRPDLPSWLAAGPADIRAAVTAAMMSAQTYDGPEAVDRALRALVTCLERNRLRAEIKLMEREHRNALERGDAQAAQAILARYVELNRLKDGLSSALARP